MNKIKQESNITSVIKLLRKKYGNDAIRRMDESSIIDIPTTSTGSLSLDIATGIGGIPAGRIIEVFGPESHGKTTVALHMIAEAQIAGYNCCFIDVEHALDPRYASAIGVDIDKLYISQPDSAEEALGICEELTRNGSFRVIVIDSVAALVPLAELEGDMEKQQVGLQARLMSKAMRKLKGEASKTNTCLVFINQVREKIGVTWGNPEVTPGGRALKFYASLRLDVRKRKQVIKNEGAIKRVIAIDCDVKVVKNKLSSPFTIGSIRIRFGTGFDKMQDLFNVAKKIGFIKRNGSIYKIKTGKKTFIKVKGESNVIKYLDKSPKLVERLKRKIIKTSI